MLLITKIFRFEMAHALHGYNGKCNNLHGHSYELHITVTSTEKEQEFIPAPGFVMDFKELKQIVQQEVIDKLDHQLVLSSAYLEANPTFTSAQNLEVWPYEPSAENIIAHIRKQLQAMIPSNIQLAKLKLYETSNSYAEWINHSLIFPGNYQSIF